MAKRGKKSERVSFRWPLERVEAVRQLAVRTGWSDGKSAAFLCQVGSDAVLGRPSKVASAREELMKVEAVHKVELEAAAMVAAARRKARGGAVVA